MSRKGFWRLKFTSRRDRFTTKLKGLKEFLRKQLNTSDTMGILRHAASVLRGWINYHAVSDNERRVTAKSADYTQMDQSKRQEKTYELGELQQIYGEG